MIKSSKQVWVIWKTCIYIERTKQRERDGHKPFLWKLNRQGLMWNNWWLVHDWLPCYWPVHSAPTPSLHVSYPRTFSGCWEKWKRKKKRRSERSDERRSGILATKALKNWKHNCVWFRQLVFTHFFTGIFPSWFTCSFSFV